MALGVGDHDGGDLGSDLARERRAVAGAAFELGAGAIQSARAAGRLPVAEDSRDR